MNARSCIFFIGLIAVASFAGCAGGSSAGALPAAIAPPAATRPQRLYVLRNPGTPGADEEIDIYASPYNFSRAPSVSVRPFATNPRGCTAAPNASNPVLSPFAVDGRGRIALYALCGNGPLALPEIAILNPPVTPASQPATFIPFGPMTTGSSDGFFFDEPMAFDGAGNLWLGLLTILTTQGGQRGGGRLAELPYPQSASSTAALVSTYGLGENQYPVFMSFDANSRLYVVDSLVELSNGNSNAIEIYSPPYFGPPQPVPIAPQTFPGVSNASNAALAPDGSLFIVKGTTGIAAFPQISLEAQPAAPPTPLPSASGSAPPVPPQPPPPPGPPISPAFTLSAVATGTAIIGLNALAVDEQGDLFAAVAAVSPLGGVNALNEFPAPIQTAATPIVSLCPTGGTLASQCNSYISAMEFGP